MPKSGLLCQVVLKCLRLLLGKHWLNRLMESLERSSQIQLLVRRVYLSSTRNGLWRTGLIGKMQTTLQGTEYLVLEDTSQPTWARYCEPQDELYIVCTPGRNTK